MSIAEKITQIAENQQKIYDKGVEDGKAQGGGDSFYDTFWDEFQLKGARKDYWGAFSGAGWTDTIFNPKYPLDKVGTSHNYMFMNTGITSISQITINASNLKQPFYNASNIKTIGTLILPQTVTSGTTPFQGMSALKNIVIDGVLAVSVDFQNSTKLSKASIISIVNALSNTKTGASLTLSKTAVNTAFGIDVDNTATYPEGSEYYTLRQSKSNWNFNYI